MKNIVIAGAGNVGICAAKSIMNSTDMVLYGFLRRREEKVPEFEDIQVRTEIDMFDKKPDGVIICVPSENVYGVEKKLLEKGINTVDAYDLHGKIYELKAGLEESAKSGNASAIIGAGWDPGLDSTIRTLLCAAIPKGKTYTDFGPGMSMGHTAAVKSIDGIENAVSITVPKGKGEHKRKVYIVLKNGEKRNDIEHEILSNEYFEHDETEIFFVDSIKDFYNTSHRVKIFHNDLGAENKQRAKFEMEIDNPSLTGEILVSAMRASFLMTSGCYFFNEVPPIYFIPNKENYEFI